MTNSWLNFVFSYVKRVVFLFFRI